LAATEEPGQRLGAHPGGAPLLAAPGDGYGTAPLRPYDRGHCSRL